MSDILKVLGQSAPTATTFTSLYTVPERAQTTTSSLVVCNRSGSAGTYRLAVRVGGAALSNKDYLFYDTALAANTSAVHVLGLTLNEGDVVTVYASTGNFSFNLFGVESAS